MTKRYAVFQKCARCLRQNNFLIEIKEADGKFYLSEKCPKCAHVEEFKEISSKEAKKYSTKTHQKSSDVE